MRKFKKKPLSVKGSEERSQIKTREEKNDGIIQSNLNKKFILERNATYTNINNNNNNPKIMGNVIFLWKSGGKFH